MQEPTTRELCARAEVTAPSLYHHFGDKDGLLATVLQEAFDEYAARKRAALGSGDLLGDFAAGWEMHVRFGLDHPLLYPTLFAGIHAADSAAGAVTRHAAAELRRELDELELAGLLRVPVDEGVSVTLAASTGCVLQLLREGGDATGPVSALMREALMGRLFGTPDGPGEREAAVRALLAQQDGLADVLGAEEAGLMRKWLGRLAAGR